MDPLIDPLTASTTLATIVGLICNYRQEISGRAATEHQTFMEWLEAHRHQEIKDLISNTYHLQSQVDELLRQDVSKLSLQLGLIEQALAAFLSRMEGFSELARRIYPTAEISEQAIDILETMHKESAQFIQPLSHGGAYGFLLLRPNGEAPFYKLDEPSFLDSDLQSLSTIGFLLLDYSPKGDPQYRPTRAGYRYVQQVRKPQS